LTMRLPLANPQVLLIMPPGFRCRCFFPAPLKIPFVKAIPLVFGDILSIM